MYKAIEFNLDHSNVHLAQALIANLNSQNQIALARHATAIKINGNLHCNSANLCFLNPCSKLVALSSGCTIEDIASKDSRHLNANKKTNDSVKNWAEQLDNFISQHQVESETTNVPRILCALTYEAGTTFESISMLAPETELALALCYQEVIIIPDEADRRAILVSFDANLQSLNSLTAWLSDLCSSFVQNEENCKETLKFVQEFKGQLYAQKVEQIKESICAGDVYQVNFTQRIKVSAGFDIAKKLKDVFLTSKPNHAFAIKTNPDRFILSASPELFLKREGNIVISEPIKGTIARSIDPEVDASALTELMNSSKDHAELAMIVDLLRNDLGRCAEVGGVKVTKECEILTLPYVHHLYSQISAEIPSKTLLSELLRATFPSGSITGAPKIAAMKMISQMERSARGYYCGAIGYLCSHTEFTLNVAIRSGEVLGDTFVFGVGGGVVYDSLGESEYAECMAKARIFLGN